jgi:glycosyltransferase involved in cell wall biosynthesis
LASFKPNACGRSAIRARLKWSDDDRVVGFLGRFVAEKGIDVLIRALPRLNTPWRALFVGGGPIQPEIERFAAAHQGRVHVLTNVEHDQVPAHLNAMDVLCAPSQTTPRWTEQFGRMLIEAMASGVPVIASSSAEMPYVVGDAGIVVPEDEDDAWTSAIDSLLADDGRREDLARRGLARARERYAWPVVAAAHLAFFQELLAR